MHEFLGPNTDPVIAAHYRKDKAMHNMKKLILSVFIFTFGFATATHASK